MRVAQTAPLTGLVAQVLLIAGLAVAAGLDGGGFSPAGWAVGVACGVVTNAALAGGLSHYRTRRLTPADWVTLTRATFAVGVAALVADAFAEPTPVTLLVVLSAVALALDAVDGWVARRTQTAGVLGAHFDGEVDAFLILVLSVYVARSVGPWVLAIGAARYVFLAAGWPLSWLRAPLPPRYWRKTVAATQGIVLTVAAADVLPKAITVTALVVALVLLAESFGRDVWWLRSHRPLIPAPAGPRVSGSPGSGNESRRTRRRVAAVLTALAGLLVWAALVAPDQPRYLTPGGFARIPLEGLVLVGLALILPATPRRVLAWTAGLVLALVVIVKILDFGFFTTFDRPFDPIGDSSNVGIGIETLRAAIGRTEANLLIGGGLLLIVALVIVTTLAVVRLTRVAASHPRPAARTVTALGAAWVLCWTFGAQFVAHTPIASTLTAGLAVDEIHAVQAALHDQGVFAKEIRRDRFSATPASELLTGLRGKDVLLVFVESYGRVTVHGSSFSPAVDALLGKGTHTLHDAGFSAQSAFLTSSTFGGVSWLAHSTLQSGVWANSQPRYDQLVGTKRFTLSDAFKRAGWRTINDAPADDRSWPAGSSFYHYDKLYDRRNVGYRGPNYTYAPMPDQYMYASLQRMELAKTHRRPLFAEVDTVSSHMPWNRIPTQIPWREVGDGSIFRRTPMDHETGAFWSNPTRVRAAYARSIKYSLNTLVSFVQHYGRRNLVLLVVGDEQPLPIVSGQNASHDVPISIIAHDRSVLARVHSWGWQNGLLPSSSAAVWPMSTLRDRFLTAFDSAQPPVP